MSLPSNSLSSDYLRTFPNPSSLEQGSSTVSPAMMDMWLDRVQKNRPQISFVIPSQYDIDHIDTMAEFKRLFKHMSDITITRGSETVYIDSMGQNITHDQIKNSAVLNMADIKNNTLTGLERFFAGTDMHSLINYLWIGVVTSLIVLTVIFILFSCYFYRKFREWKKCNKDIRAHFNDDMYPGSSMPCNAAANPEAAYYQVESPPCYTIATGLPTYDEALHHNQQNFAFGMKFIYPTLAAVHHQASNLISSWEKYDNTSKDQKAVNASTANKCKLSEAQLSKSFQATSSSSSSSISFEASSATSPSAALLLPPPYEVAATMALLSEQVTAYDNVAITIPQLDTYELANTSSDLTDVITV